MTSVFPGGVDPLRNDVTNATAEYDTHPDLHNQAADAITAVQTELLPGGTLSLEDHLDADDAHPGYLTRADADATYQTQVQADARYLQLNTPQLAVTGSITPGNGTVVGVALWSGDGVPDVALGTNGDVYFRRDSAVVALERIYVKASGAWLGIL